jgi:hypothetical protein
MPSTTHYTGAVFAESKKRELMDFPIGPLDVKLLRGLKNIKFGGLHTHWIRVARVSPSPKGRIWVVRRGS